MKILRALVWLFACAPCAAAFAWTSLAARYPEEDAARRALSECTWRWDFASAMAVDGEPAHVLARLLHLSVLHLPGCTIRLAAFANALLAVLLVGAVVRLVRHAAPTRGVGTACVVAVAGLLVCDPGFGANWLHGERLGRLLVPLLMVSAGPLLAIDSRSWWRTLLALACVVCAPFCAESGCIVFLALVPALGAGRRPLLVAMLLAGNVAAIAACNAVSPLFPGTGVSATILAGEPLRALADLLRVTGALWPDFLPRTDWDELGLGIVSWAVLPASFVCPAAGSACVRGAFRACIAYGLLAVLWHLERHGLPAGGEALTDALARREALQGAGVLLVVGVVGTLAVLCGTTVWIVAGGIVVALAGQGWDRGLAVLRAARWHVDHVEARVRLQLPSEFGGLRAPRWMPCSDVVLKQLEDRGWVPRVAGDWLQPLVLAASAAGDAAAGTFAGGDATHAYGSLVSHLFGAQSTSVVIAALADGKIVGISAALPAAASLDGCDVPWTATSTSAFPDGASVVLVAYDARNGIATRFPGQRVVRNGTIVEGP